MEETSCKVDEDERGSKVDISGDTGAVDTGVECRIGGEADDREIVVVVADGYENTD